MISFYSLITKVTIPLAGLTDVKTSDNMLESLKNDELDDEEEKKIDTDTELA